MASRTSAGGLTQRADARVRVNLRVNGVTHAIWVEPRTLLSDALREECGLTGTHVGCEHGVCGACTVWVDGVAVRSCLLFAVQVAGAEVRTVEGLADLPQGQALQQAFHEHHALQCGFCTPGVLLSAAELLARNPEAQEDEVVDVLSGHLCRCTGYTSIVQAVQSAAATMRENRGGDTDEPRNSV
ncbi:MAG: (2Fe-2S)-binding protein [Alicyclobacillus sp.]|nr:(2Fe-2S)-binding protein [Alicyclobacillus sp.]